MDIAAGMEHLHSLGVLHVRAQALDILPISVHAYRTS